MERRAVFCGKGGRPLLGYVIYGEGPKRPETGFREIRGGWFSTLTIRAAAQPFGPITLRRVQGALLRWREMGVRYAVFPVDFPYMVLAQKAGIRPVDTMPLRRALAVPVTRIRLREMGLLPAEAVAAVTADKVSEEVHRAVTELSRSFRYVMLSAGKGGEALAGELRREYGVSLLQPTGAETLERADALLLFASRPELTLRNRVVYALYPDAERFQLPLLLPECSESPVGDNCDREQLAAALYGMGVMPLEAFFAEIRC